MRESYCVSAETNIAAFSGDFRCPHAVSQCEIGSRSESGDSEKLSPGPPSGAGVGPCQATFLG